MIDFRICVEDQIFIDMSYPHLVNTIFYISYQGKCFPDNIWTDFSYPLLEIWSSKLIEYKDVYNTNIELVFMDGPYAIQLFRNGSMNLHVNCVKNEIACFEFDCSYRDFLNAIFEALKALYQILLVHGLDKGKFVSVFNQTEGSIKNLEKLITAYE